MSRDEVHAVGWPVVVLPYDARWPELFRLERDRLAGIFGERATGIEHIGSTAVPGLAAKGIVDILLGLRALELRPENLDAMTRLGYLYRGEARDSKSPLLPEGRAADTSRACSRAWLGRMAE